MHNQVLKYNEFFEYIQEGLIKTYPIKTAIKLISRDLSLRDITFKIDSENETNTIFIKLLSSNIDLNVLLGVYRTINLCGYFVSNYDFYSLSDTNIDYLIHNDKVDKKFIEELTQKLNGSQSVQLTIK